MTSFLKDQSGAVTVDWVVLTAALVGVGIATMTVVSQGTQDISGDIKDELNTDVISISMLRFNYNTLYDLTDTAIESFSGTTLISSGSMIGIHGSFPRGTELHATNQANQLRVMSGYPNAYITQRSDYPTYLSQMQALDRSTVTASEIASITGANVSDIEDDITNHAGGSATTYYDAQLAVIEMRANEYQEGVERATELGLI